MAAERLRYCGRESGGGLELPARKGARKGVGLRFIGAVGQELRQLRWRGLPNKGGPGQAALRDPCDVPGAPGVSSKPPRRVVGLHRGDADRQEEVGAVPAGGGERLGQAGEVAASDDDDVRPVTQLPQTRFCLGSSMGSASRPINLPPGSNRVSSSMACPP